jgi:hypothetical protein
MWLFVIASLGVNPFAVAGFYGRATRARRLYYRRGELMAKQRRTAGARVGDWVEARGLPGRPSRRGEIIELLRHDSREHYRVRWDDQHESIVYPADGVVIIPRRGPASAGR